MKKCYSILLAVLILSGMVSAQRLMDLPSAGRAPDSKQQEQIIGGDTRLVPTQRAFGHDLYQGTLGPCKFWLNTPGTLTNLNTTTRSIFGADFNGTGVWYGVDYDDNALVTCDTSTGVFAVVGTTNPGGANVWTGLSWDRTSNTMYGCAYIGSASYLFTVDLSTAQCTQIGMIGSYICIDIAINNAGQIYGHEINTDNIITISKTTGAGTILGPTGIAANYAQGMSFDPNTDELYLAGYTSGGALYTVNTTTGACTLVGAFPGGAEVDGFAIPGGFGAPCPVGQPTNPTPADGATNIAINGVQLHWTNPGNANSMELYFGTNPGSLTQVYTGPLTTSYNVPGTLSYFTTYYWRIKEKNDTCGNFGPLWSFKTLQDPNLFFAVDDAFENGPGLWTITNDGGTCVWQIRFAPFPNSYTLPATSTGGIFTADVDECGSGTTILSTATLTNGVNLSNYQTVMLEFDSDWYPLSSGDQAIVDVSNDGGTTWTNVMLYGSTSVRNEHKIIDVSAQLALHNNVKIRFKAVEPAWDWWWVIDNVQLKGSNLIPVELVSFKAAVNGNSVNLSWMTATETNNSGFDVERSLNGGAYVKIGNVTGHGTTTEMKSYSFTDTKLANGNYTYRLKQVDYDGAFKYSAPVNAEVNAPMEYSLDQNYPNPFNPSTKISFTLAADSKVSLKVFNLLGQEVATIAQGQMTAGSYNYNFDASGLNSGVYFYQIEAQGNNGSSFKSVKKMMLTK